jgi:hypothetical protein
MGALLVEQIERRASRFENTPLCGDVRRFSEHNFSTEFEQALRILGSAFTQRECGAYR